MPRLPPIITLENSITRLTLSPETGGSIVNWLALEGGHWLLRHSSEGDRAERSPRRLACYPLLPWSNRIGRGGFQQPDGWLALPANSPGDPLPIHGSAWQQAWALVEQDSLSATLELESTQPFHYRARQRFELEGGALRISLQVTHLGEGAAWYGMGLHPYLPRTEQTRLQVRAGGVWLCDSDGLSERLSEIPPEWDFQQSNPLPSTVDNAFTEWDGECLITQADAGYQLYGQARGSDCFMLFCPPGKDFFCFEPVSHPVNAHHLSGRPGLRLLAQGQQASLEWSLTYLRLA